MGTGTVQSLVSWLRIPCNMSSCPYQMSTWFWSKLAVHPASHSWPTESNELVRKWGNRYAVRADCGIIGICNWVAELDSICEPFGRDMAMLGVSVHVGTEVVNWSERRKCPVLPVSKMVSMDILVVAVVGGEGGPSELAVCKKSVLNTFKICGVHCGSLLGSPPSQLVTGGVVVGVLRGGGT
jgi:hypothetical protein